MSELLIEGLAYRYISDTWNFKLRDADYNITGEFYSPKRGEIVIALHSESIANSNAEYRTQFIQFKAGISAYVTALNLFASVSPLEQLASVCQD